MELAQSGATRSSFMIIVRNSDKTQMYVMLMCLYVVQIELEPFQINFD